MDGKVKYGRRKLDAKQYAAQDEKKTSSTRQATVYGTRKGGRRPGSNMPVGEGARTRAGVKQRKNPFERKDGTRVTIDQLESILAADPSLIDVAIESEAAHEDKPRKGAVDVLRKVEGARAAGPRPGVMKYLDQLVS